MEIELSRIPMTMTCDQALPLFCNMVNQKHLPQMGAAQNRVRRNVNEVLTGRGHGHTGRGGFGRGGRGGGHTGCGGRGQPRQTRTDSHMITLTDGLQQVECHASFSFPRHIFMKMKQEDKDTL